ncbi:MAG TPA: hypothetical protein VGS20_06400 [Candidatus Acidoferrales bacterium]|nr:hypothetical protein [Candidatus Acidoferrales bacterium]
MADIILYILAAVSCAVQVYQGVTHGLWWAPPDPLPMAGLAGILLMLLGSAWGAVKGSSAAWFVFVGAIFCWAFYVPGLGNLLGSMRQSLMEGRLNFGALDVYLPLLPPILLLIATIKAFLVGPLGKASD